MHARQNRLWETVARCWFALAIISCPTLVGCEAGVGETAAAIDAAGPAIDAADVTPPVIADAALADANFSLLCDQIYGGAPGYIACEASGQECAFANDTNGATCESVCTAVGGKCIDARDNPATPGQECTEIPNTDDNCLTAGRTTEICVCSGPEATPLPDAGLSTGDPTGR